MFVAGVYSLLMVKSGSTVFDVHAHLDGKVKVPITTRVIRPFKACLAAAIVLPKILWKTQGLAPSSSYHMYGVLNRFSDVLHCFARSEAKVANFIQTEAPHQFAEYLPRPFDNASKTMKGSIDQFPHYDDLRNNDVVYDFGNLVMLQNMAHSLRNLIAHGRVPSTKF